MFIDVAGIDRYSTPANGVESRGTGSLGVFVDLDGQDLFREGLADGQATVKPSWSVSYDAELQVATPVDGGPARVKPIPGSVPKPSEADLAAIYKKATQWGVGTAQQEVADNIDKLICIGVPALEWMLDNKLKTADRLQERAFVQVTKALGADGATAIGRKMLSKPSDIETTELLSIAMDAGVTDVGALLPDLIEKPAFQKACVRAAGALKAAACIPALNRLCLSQDKLLARAAMVSLMQIGDADSVSTAQAILGSQNRHRSHC